VEPDCTGGHSAFTAAIIAPVTSIRTSWNNARSMSAVGFGFVAPLDFHNSISIFLCSITRSVAHLAANFTTSVMRSVLLLIAKWVVVVSRWAYRGGRPWGAVVIAGAVESLD
jgi:hypothetical protein